MWSGTERKKRTKRRTFSWSISGNKERLLPARWKQTGTASGLQREEVYASKRLMARGFYESLLKQRLANSNWQLAIAQEAIWNECVVPAWQRTHPRDLSTPSVAPLL